MNGPERVNLPRVLVVIVTYNSAAHIAPCLDSIVAETARVEVLVCDNASADASADIARHHPSAPEVIANGVNLGFGRAINQAADGRAFDYLLLLNPDAVLHEGALDALVTLAQGAPHAGLYGGRAIGLDGRAFPEMFHRTPNLLHAARFAACFGFLPGTSALAPDAAGRHQLQGTVEVPAIEGSLTLITRDAWQRLGGFDEAFFLYGEDVDLSMRARALGYRPLLADGANYTHVRGASSPSKADNTRMILKGRAMLYRRYAGGRPGVALLAAGVWLRATFEPLVRDSDTWRQAWRQRAYWLEPA